MTPLLVVAALIFATGMSGSMLRRNRYGRRFARRQQEALDRLGHLSTTSGGADLPSPAVAPRQAHVRVVSADAEPPPLTPRPLTGGWRPTRATGAAPFRRPQPRTLPAAISADPAASVYEYRVDDEDIGGVRLVGPGSGESVESAAEREELGSGAQAADGPAPETSATDRPMEDDASGTVGASSLLLPAPALTSPPGDPDVAPRYYDRAPGASPLSAAPPTLSLPPTTLARFDDLEPPADLPDAPDPPPPAVDPDERSEWASRLAAAGAPLAAARREDRSPRRRRAHRAARSRGTATGRTWKAAAAGVVVLLAAGGAAATLGLAHHAAAPRATGPAHHPAPSPTAPARTVPTTTPAAAKLVATASGAATYQLAGPSQITLTASGPCWVEIRSGGASGAVSFVGTLQAGQSQAVAGPAWLRLGNPTAVAVAVNGQAVKPPVTQGTPYDLTFQ